MPYSNGLFRPDFTAPRVDLPEWVPMDEEQDMGGVGGMAQMLKKRLGQSGSSKSASATDTMGTAGKSMGGPGSSSL